MKNCGRHRQNGIKQYDFSEFLENSIKVGGNKIAIKTLGCSLTYEELYEKIKKRYEYLKKRNITKLAISENNSIDLCIDLLTGFIYLETIFIFSGTLELLVAKNYCKDNGIPLLIKNNKEYFIDTNEVLYVPEDVKTVLFTSGTNQLPKGVMLTGENLYTNILSTINGLQYNITDILLITKPIYHSYGLTIEFLSGISANATLFLYNEIFNPKKIMRIINNESITIWCTIPTMLALILNSKMDFLGKVRIVAIGGAILDVDIIKKAKKFFKLASILQLYGLTEASPLVTISPYNLKENELGTIGRAISGTTLEIRDNNNSLISTPYTCGELVVSGPGVMKGYFGNELETKRVLKNGKLYTGDIVYFDNNELFYYKGRKDSMITRCGINIYCSDIEMSLRLIPEVKEVSVIGIEDVLYSQIIVAFIQCLGEISKEKIKSYCIHNKITIPDKIVFLDSMPYTDSGKISKKSLKEFYKKYFYFKNNTIR